MAKKITITVKCVECGRDFQVRDYQSRWPDNRGLCNRPECIESHFAKLAPPTVKEIDLFAQSK